MKKTLKLDTWGTIEVDMAKVRVDKTRNLEVDSLSGEEYLGAATVTVTNESGTFEVMHSYETLCAWHDQAVKEEERLESLTSEELSVDDIKDLSLAHFQDAVALCAKHGRSIFLYEQNTTGFATVVLRKMLTNVRLTVTNPNDEILFNGRFGTALGIDVVAEQYWNIFNLVKDQIKTQ